MSASGDLKASLPAQMARFWERQEQLRRECDAPAPSNTHPTTLSAHGRASAVRRRAPPCRLTPCWINVSSFCALIEENYDYNLIGVQGYAEPLSYVLRADYVINTTDHWNVRLNTIYPNPSSVTFERIVRFRQS